MLPYGLFVKEIHMAKKQQKAQLGRVGRVEREKRITKLIQISMVGIIAVVAVVVIAGLIISTFVTPNIVIATVYDQEITVGEFQTRVRFQRAQMIEQMEQYASYYQLTSDPTFQQQIASIIQQIQIQLDNPQALGQLIINEMIDDILVQREAAESGITVTEDDILEEVGSIFGYYPNGYPTYTPVPTAEPEESAEDGTSVEAPAIAEPTSVTVDEYEQSLTEFLSAYEQYGVTQELFFELIEIQLYRQKFSNQLAEGIDNLEDQVWARHILVGDQETAESVLERLEAGEAFEDLAAELSTDGSAATGGDLGWFNDSRMVAPFSEAAFDAEVGEVAGPVETQFGFHIIEVLGREMRPMAETDFNNLVSLALADLISTLKEPAEEAGDIVLNPDWSKYIPTDPASPYAGQPAQ
jgi:parvulin-like peptidyl-prolyl isomerase